MTRQNESPLSKLRGRVGACLAGSSPGGAEEVEGGMIDGEP
jgi:hypothetical protein